ncbi:MAG: nuclear transport factor 2 family protein [Chthoniobacterales bacterium]
MQRILLVGLLLVTLSAGLQAEPAPAAPELTKLLQEFLAGASRNDAAMHERFWADDLIYTASAGRRIGKADILREVKEENASAKPDVDNPTYSAEDIQIHQYGDTAVVAFRLIATSDNKGKKSVSNYLNTGTFVKRDGKWQAVAWQATAVPKKEASKTEG